MAIIVGATAAFILVWVLLPPLLYRSVVDEATRLKAITDTRTALLAGLVGVAALGTLAVNARTQRFTAETLRISEKNFELTERGHITDRYAKAIEQLGDDTLDVRLGGIYSLEQIATDTPRDRDKFTIVEVLSAFVRVHSDPLYQYKAALPKTAPAESAEEQRRKAARYVGDLKGPPVDVQAAVTVLGRLPARFGAHLFGSNLTEAWLWGPNLTGVWLSKAILGLATLTKADLSAAELTEADLRAADLREADLRAANLTEADLTAADLYEARLARANLTGTDLTRANLTRANLTRANLTKARLGAANLTSAVLTGADLSQADLGEADLYGADLTQADLTEAVVTQSQLDVAGGDSETKLPLGRQRPKRWQFSDPGAPH
jgi:hypothetical protein